MTNSELLISLTSSIATAFVSNNSLAVNEIGAAIQRIYDALLMAGQSQKLPDPVYIGATTMRKSLANPDKLISMIDGKAYSSLKRHLSSHGMTPEAYRARYDLPQDYPMIAPGYSLKRRALSLKAGLGRKPRAGALVQTQTNTAPDKNIDTKTRKRKSLSIAVPKDATPNRSRR